MGAAGISRSARFLGSFFKSQPPVVPLHGTIRTTGGPHSVVEQRAALTNFIHSFRTTRSQRCSLYSTSMRKSLTTNTGPQVPIAMVALLNKRGAPAPCRLPCVVQSAPTQFFERLEGPTGRRGRFLCSRGWSSRGKAQQTKRTMTFVLH